MLKLIRLFIILEVPQQGIELVPVGIRNSRNVSIDLGKGSKIKLIIFAEFSAKGGGGPPIRENN